mmetsp:Transcript_55490/g.119776  ORF Transcript_55490/g.119776 Transcript_55490/m.119776 type:complete len:207 (-) Transcript_55490:81-701(-)
MRFSLECLCLALAWLRPSAAFKADCSAEKPPTWPVRFRAEQRRVPTSDPNCEANCSNVTTYYDWERQANLIIDQPDFGKDGPLWDLELGNHSSYYVHPLKETCMYMHFQVGILRPDWLQNATYMGKSTIQGVSVHGWTKVDFIDYYASVEDCSPVSWYFHTMKTSFNTIGFFPDEAVPDESYFRPPDYCHTPSPGEARQGSLPILV